jgi:hypothetical protein
LYQGHYWVIASDIADDSRPGFHRQSTRCSKCYKRGKDIWITDAEFTKEIEDAEEAYRIGNPYQEVGVVDSDGNITYGIQPNPNFDPNWQPRNESQRHAANYIRDGEIYNNEK